MSLNVTDEMVGRAAAEIYHCYVAEAVRGALPMEYVRRWHELDEPFRAMWRRCARAGLEAAHADELAVIKAMWEGDKSADKR